MDTDEVVSGVDELEVVVVTGGGRAEVVVVDAVLEAVVAGALLPVCVEVVVLLVFELGVNATYAATPTTAMIITTTTIIATGAIPRFLRLKSRVFILRSKVS